MQITYKVDPAHSSAQFIVRHMMITNVRGGFTGVRGTVVYDSDNPSASNIDVTIDVSTLSTGDSNRDAHVKGPDFLDAEKYPSITFKSTTVTKGSGHLVKGNLTIHGVTREALLDVDGPTPEEKDPWGNARIGASATTKIKRSDFGLTWNTVLDSGGIMLGDDLKLEIDVSLIKG